MSYQFLVVSDTNHIVPYLYANSKYRFIRGASALLDQLNLHRTTEVAKANKGVVLSKGGGEARVLFQTEEDAKAYINGLQAAYRNRTDEISLTMACVERNNNESMVHWLERAESMLRVEEKASGKKAMPESFLYPLVVRCKGCGKRAAEAAVDLPGSANSLQVCLSCFKKHEQYTSILKTLKQLEKGQENSSLSGLMEIHQRLIQENGRSSWIKKLADLQSEESASKKSSYNAFVYADGKQIGRFFRDTVLKNLKNSADDAAFIEKYQSFSKNVNESIVQAAVRTAAVFPNVPVDYAVVGGDDFVAMMPGDAALLYMDEFIQQFENISKKLVGQPLLIGAGIVIAHASYPVSELFPIAYGLMEQAKKKWDNISILDYRVLTDTVLPSVEKMNEMDNSVFGKPQLVLKNRSVRTNGWAAGSLNNPKAPKDQHIKELIKVIRNLKKAGFPSSKIKDVYRIVREENEQVMEFEWQSWRTRLHDKHSGVLDNWNPSFKKTPYVSTSAGKKETGILDLFDLYDIIQPEEK